MPGQIGCYILSLGVHKSFRIGGSLERAKQPTLAVAHVAVNFILAIHDDQNQRFHFFTPDIYIGIISCEV